MLLDLNFKSGKPVYLQIVDQVKASAATGGLKAGDLLPSIRPLAEQLRINRNTVAKAYAELESQGIVETQAGKGCFVKETGSVLRKEARKEILGREIDAVIFQAHHLQIEDDELLTLVRRRLDAFAGQRARHEAESKEVA
jgi:GntR family transcriptional regulator